MGRDDLREVIAAQLRDGLPLGAGGVRDALIAHLGTRLDVMESNLAELPPEARQPHGLRTCSATFVAGNRACRTSPPPTLIAPLDKVLSFPRRRMDTAGLSTIADKLELFDRFGTLEDEIEPLETALRDIADAIAAAGEVAADIGRGA